MHNLLFIAYGQSIHVYVPSFPSQEIAEKPSLIFTSQPSSHGLTGYIDQRNPHTINNLVVELFGTEEVIAVVRDDGDVDGFLTRHIVQAIERRDEPGSTIGIEGDEIRPFFQSNVGLSAWGLAIHSEARILATSSNAHEVRVFKFGLLRADALESLASEDGNDSSESTGESTAAGKQHRKTDVTHHVLNGETNIPCIAFCNTGDDPDARWLLTTDISGVCRVMDLRSLEALQAFRFGRSFATAHLRGFDQLNAGWAIMFLDRRSFRKEHDLSFALGVEDGVEKVLPKVHRSGEIWDLSNTARRLEEYAEPFMPRPWNAGLQGDGGAAVLLESSDALLEHGSPDLTFDVDLSDSIEYADSSDDGGADVDIEIDMREEIDDDEAGGIEVEINDDPMHMNEDDDTDYQTAEEDEVEELNESNPEASDLHANHLIGEVPVSDAEDPDDEGTEDTISYTSFYSGESIVGNDPRFVHPTTTLCDGLPCPVLHASIRNVYLLQPPRKMQRGDANDSTTAFQPPMLGLANPLKQPIHLVFGHLRDFERLNMNVSIPSLGIVILASQKGRVLVLSLTKITPSTTVPPSLADFSCQDKSVYGMKIEAILPFAEQERQNLRSGYPLHGIAASPLQGTNGKKGRRWRLLMMYQDHSILSYELSRRNVTGDSGVDVGTVVV